MPGAHRQRVAYVTNGHDKTNFNRLHGQVRLWRICLVFGDRGSIDSGLIDMDKRRYHYIPGVVCLFLVLVLYAQAVEPLFSSTWASIGQNQSLQVYRGGRVFTFSHDGKVLASADQAMIILQDVSTGQVRLTLQGSNASGFFADILFSADNKTIASVDQARQVTLWDAESGSLKFSLTGAQDVITGLAFSPNNKIVASGEEDNKIALWAMDSGSRKAILSGHTGAVAGLAFSPDGKVLASGGKDTHIKLWDVASARAYAALAVPFGTAITGLVFGPQGDTLAGLTEDARIVVWDIGSGSKREFQPDSAGTINGLAFSPDGTLIAGGRSSTEVGLLEVKSGDARKRQIARNPGRP